MGLGFRIPDQKIQPYLTLHRGTRAPLKNLEKKKKNVENSKKFENVKHFEKR